MLLTEIIDVRWNNSNRKQLEEFGYEYTINGELITIQIKHLNKNSNLKVEVICDYCGKTIEKSYQNYNTQREKLDKDSCYDCRYEKEKEILKEKQSNNEINIGERRYYLFKENRLKEVENYINKYNTLDNIYKNEDGNKLCGNLRSYDEDVYNLAVELGYDLKLLIKKKPSWYYKDFDVFKKDIQEIIDKQGFFPNSYQLMRELRISNRTISYHGGMQKVRELMGYDDIKYLDNSGFYNSSLYETIVANYLIAQGLDGKYKREQSPFPKHEGNYRSDFTFYIRGGEDIHCEVWGLSDERHEKYNKIRKIKENLYDKYSLELISIEPKGLDKKTYKEIDKYLYNKFKYYLKLPFKTVSQEKLIPSSLLTDEELLSEIMKYSDNDGYLPTTNQLRGEVTGYYNEIMKRYDNYQEFGKKFNKKVEFASNGYWTQDKIFEIFDYMILNYGRILNRTECKEDKKLQKFSYIIQSNNYGGFINNKLDYFKYLQDNKKAIPDTEIKFLYDISRDNSTEYSGSIDEDKINKAQNIMQTLKTLGLLDEKYHDFIRPNYNQEDKMLNLVFDVFVYMVNEYGGILSENKYSKLKKDDEKLREINPYKRIQRSKYNLAEVKDLFNLYLKSLSSNQQIARIN